MAATPAIEGVVRAGLTSLPYGGVAGVVSERLYCYFTSIISIVAMHRWMRVMAADGMEREEKKFKGPMAFGAKSSRHHGCSRSGRGTLLLAYSKVLYFTLSNSNVEFFVLPNVLYMCDVPTLASSQSR